MGVSSYIYGLLYQNLDGMSPRKCFIIELSSERITQTNKWALFRYNCGLIRIGERLEIVPDAC
jgi:hypothetical protein